MVKFKNNNELNLIKMSKVNLDALIPREDFDILADKVDIQNSNQPSVSVRDIKDLFFIKKIRKPDFQRETNEWDSEKILDFIKSFVDGELIPAIIFWQAPNGQIFVIDGSHRLSALISWVNDDYGDGKCSQEFYTYNIPEEQKIIARETRKLIDEKIGSFAKLEYAMTNKSKDFELDKRANTLWGRNIILQWVNGGTEKAESSFFKINESASPINETEKKLLKSRKQPNCIAARAIIKSGTGHKYWSSFAEKVQNEIQELSKKIYDILFLPKLKTPIKTLDTPIGGPTFKVQTLPLVFEFVNIVNDIKDKTKLDNDVNGDKTIQYLKSTLKIARRINDNHVSSLGLHPVVYFYSQQGRHKPASFYAIVALMKEFENKNTLSDFITVRDGFEQFILTNDDLISQITRKKRSGMEAHHDIKDFFVKIIELIKQKNSDIFNEIIKIKKFNYLKSGNQNKDISTNSERKSSVFLREALEGCVKCKICNGYLHTNSISMDHIHRKQDGGSDEAENLQMTHPYCNSTVKN